MTCSNIKWIFPSKKKYQIDFDPQKKMNQVALYEIVIFFLILNLIILKK